VDLLNVLRSNSSMASVLCSYTAMSGDWRTVIQELQLVEDMQLSTLRQVATETFRSDNQYLGYVDKA
jgi:predicted Zn-dependent peptidase